MPEAVRNIGTYVCGECDWTQNCLKQFVAAGALKALAFGITPSTFAQQHPRGQTRKGHWHQFCGWRNGGLSGSVDCESCVHICRLWPPLHTDLPTMASYDVMPSASVHSPPFAPPLQDAEAPPVQDAEAPPLEDDRMVVEITPRKSARKHSMSNPASPEVPRSKAKKYESTTVEDLKIWLEVNRPGMYEYVEAGRGKNVQPRVVCLACTHFLEMQQVLVQGPSKTKKQLTALCRKGFGVQTNSWNEIKRHEMRTVSHQFALEAFEATRGKQASSELPESSQTTFSQGQAASSKSESSQSIPCQGQTTTMTGNQLVLHDGESSNIFEEEGQMCIGVNLQESGPGATTRAYEVQYISPPPSIIPAARLINCRSNPTTIHTRRIPTFQHIPVHSNIPSFQLP